jgi:hypothetical protein
VDGTWKRCTHDFTGPERPAKVWHFGHQLTFTGPGTLWMDNGRIARCDRPEDARYGDQDLGDGSTPVTLRPPLRNAAKITLHKLAGDPRASNREKMTIDIQSQDVPAAALDAGTFTVNERTGGARGGMPPGSIYLYVFEATE